MAADKKLASIGQLISHVAVKQEEEWLPENLYATDAEFQEFMAADRTPSFKPEAEHSPSDEQLLAADSERLNDSFDFKSAELELNEEFLSDTNDSASTIDPRGNNQRVIETVEEEQAGVGISHEGSELDHNIYLPEDGQFSANTTDSNSASCSRASNERVLQAAKIRQADECSDTCKLCPIVLPKECMAMHMLEVHHAPRLSSKERDILRQHAMVCNGPHKEGNSYRCQLCPGSYKTKHALARHNRIHDENRPRNYACGRCDSKFLDKSALDRHQNVHTREKKYTCNECAKVFYSEAGLLQHVRRHAGGRYSCEECGGRFPDKLQFEKHVLCCNPADKGRYKCTLCNKDCTTQQGLTMHYKNHKELPWKCTICAKGFNIKPKALRHVKLCHNMAKNTIDELNKFVCEGPRANEPSIGMEPTKSTTNQGENFHCQAESDSYEVQQSTRSPLTTNDSEDAVGEREEEFLDDSASCSRAANPDPTEDQQGGHITRHLKTHNIVRKMACHLCRKKFDNPNSLLEHARGHIGQTHNCKRCGARFLEKSALESHVSSCNYDGTSKKKRYKCRICDRDYASEYGLKLHYVRNHLARVHRMEEEEHRLISKGLTDIESLIGLEPPASTTTVMEHSHSVAEAFEAQQSLGYQQTTNNSRDAETELLFEEPSLKDKNDSASASCSRGANLNTTEDRQARHIESHEGIRPQNYSCEGCDAKFLDMHALDWHLKTHTIDRQFACRLCQKVFDNTNSLLAHARSHIGQTHNCHRCGARFLAKAALESHVLSCNYDGSERYECRICDHNDGSEKGLKWHYKLHIGLPLECSICSKGFLLKVNVRNHLAEVHRMTDKSEEELNKFISDAVTDIESLIGLDPPASTTTAMEHSHSAAEASEVQPSHGNRQTPNNSQDAETELKKIYRCQFCPESYTDKRAFARHNRIHDENSGRKFACGQCDSMFLDKPALVRHLKTHARKFACRLCQNVFDNTNSLLAHARGHIGQTHNCKRCGARFLEKAAFESHALSCNYDGTSKKKRYECKICDRDYTSEYFLKLHYVRSHLVEVHRIADLSEEQLNKFLAEGVKDIEALIGLDPLASTTTARKHCHSAEDAKEVQQSLGNRPPPNNSQDSESELMFEEASLKDKNDSASASCSRGANWDTTEDQQAVYTKNHEGVSAQHYSCERCDVKFLDVSALDHHLNTHHTTDNKFACPVCRQVFYNSDSLQSHVIQHAGKTFKCERCGAPFLSKTALEMHVICCNGTSKKKKCKCTVCDKDFHSVSELRLHYKVHTGTLPWKCSVCGKEFTKKCKVRRHLSAVHKMADKTEKELNQFVSANESRIGMKPIKSTPTQVETSHSEVEAYGIQLITPAAQNSNAAELPHVEEFLAEKNAADFDLNTGHNPQGGLRIDAEQQIKNTQTHDQHFTRNPQTPNDSEEAVIELLSDEEFLDDRNGSVSASSSQITNRHSLVRAHDQQVLVSISHEGSELCHEFYSKQSMETSHNFTETELSSHGEFSASKNDSNTASCCQETIPDDMDAALVQQTRIDLTALDSEINKIDTETETFYCEICPNTFKRDSDLKAHMRHHDVNRVGPYPDDHNAQKHLNAHGNKRKRQLTCRFCEKTFVWQHDLEVHMRLHASDTPSYNCHLCGRSYALKGSLRRHLLHCHSSESLSQRKLYKCTDCDEEFGYRSLLYEHRQVHTGLPSWKCRFCGKKYQKGEYLRSHLKRFHKITDTSELSKLVGEVSTANEASIDIEDTPAIDTEATQSTATVLRHSYIEPESNGVQLFTPAAPTENDTELPHDDEFLGELNAADFDFNGRFNPQPALDIDFEQQIGASIVHTNTETHEAHIPSLTPQTLSDASEDAEFMLEEEFINHKSGGSDFRAYQPRILEIGNELPAERGTVTCELSNNCFPIEELEDHISQAHGQEAAQREEYPGPFEENSPNTKTELILDEEFLDDKKNQASASCSEGIYQSVLEKVNSQQPRVAITHEERELCVNIYASEFIEDTNVPSIDIHDDNQSKNFFYACEHCDSKFANVTSLQIHLNAHAKERRADLTCQLCKRQYNTITGLDKHMDSHIGNSSNCRLCGRRFAYRPSLKKHMVRCSGEASSRNRRYKCKDCGQEYVNKHSFDKHRREGTCVHWKCRICEKQFTNRNGCRSHTGRTHKLDSENVREFMQKIPITKEPEPEIQIIQSTTEDEHSPIAYFIQLSIPAPQTPSVAELLQHEGLSEDKNASDADPLARPIAQPTLELFPQKQASANIAAKGTATCPFCHNVFPKECMEAHMEQIHQKKGFQCKFCLRWFQTEGGLTVHHRTCKAEAPYKDIYQCKLCPRSYKLKFKFEQHFRRHQKNRPRNFPCEYCDSKFLDNSALVKHTNSHTKATKYPCGSCEKVFYTASGLRLHKRIHTGDTLNCELCGARYTEKSRFNRHVEICNRKHSSVTE